MRSDKKVIILDNINSDLIEQAMFILKDEKSENIDAVSEAEQIVANYMKRYRYTLYSGRAKKRRRISAVFLGVFIGMVVFLGILAFNAIF